MQTTLLGLAIVVILALATALVGPAFVDWGSYRGWIEDWVGHATKLEVRIEGHIDLQLLPTPTLRLQKVEFGRWGDSNKTRARELRVELAPGSLLGGEWRATQLKLRGPQFALALDQSGRLDWSALAVGSDPDALSIEQLEIEDGQATLTYAASGAQLSLDKLSFSGQVGSLIGPVKGDGSFAMNGQPVVYKYRLAMGRRGDDGNTKVRLTINPPEGRRLADAEPARQTSSDLDGTIRFEKNVPQFEGTLQVAGRPGSLDALTEPWRMSGHLHIDNAKAQFDQIDLQYGAEEQSVAVRGDVNVALGAKPELVATLSAMQIDLDRMLGQPQAGGRRPPGGIRRLAEALSKVPQSPIAMKLKLSADSVTLAGGTLQRVTGELSSSGGDWQVDRFRLRAPGLTQVAFDGRLAVPAGGAALEGLAQIDSDDPRALAAWLADSGDLRLPGSGPFHFKSKVVLSGGKMGFDQLQVALDRMKIDGHVNYAWRADGQAATLDAALRAPELDLDRVLPLLSAAFADQSLDWPWEGMLAVEIGRVVGAGIEAKDISVNLRGNSQGFEIERSAIGDIGGAKLAVAGRMDTRGAARGKMDFDLNARSLDGLAALIEKFSMPAADRIRRAAARAVPIDLHASLAVNGQGQAASNRSANAEMTLKGSAGMLGLDLEGNAANVVWEWTNLAKLATSTVQVKGRIDAGDRSALIELLGLDGLVAVDPGPAGVKLDISGPLDGDLKVTEASLHSRDFNIDANGAVRLLGGQAPSAKLAVQASARNIEPFRHTSSARVAQLPWTTFNAALALADNTIKLTGLNGSAAGVPYSGRLDLALGSPPQIDGDLTIASLDLPSVIGAAIGLPHPPGSADGAWVQAPFEAGLLGGIGGRITVNADALAVTSGLTARHVGAELAFAPARMEINVIDGGLASGRLTGHLNIEREDDGVKAGGRLDLAAADVTALLGGESKSPLSGRLTVNLGLDAAGRSPFALISSLKGEGMMAWQDGAITRLDPGVFEAMTRAVDRDPQADTRRIRDRVETAMGAGRLPVSVEAALAIEAGQLRLIDPAVRATGADVALGAAAMDLVQGAINVRMVVSPSAADTAGGRQPEISLRLDGPIDQPRRAVDASGLINWLARRHADVLEEQAARGGENSVGAVERDPTATVPTAIVVPPREPRPSATVPASSRDTRPSDARPNDAHPSDARPATAAPAPSPTPAPPRQRPAASAPLPPPLDIRPPVAHPPRG